MQRRTQLECKEGLGDPAVWYDSLSRDVSGECDSTDSGLGVVAVRYRKDTRVGVE